MKKLLAERTKAIDSSGIRKIFSLAAEMESPVDLSIGQPDFDVPEPVKEAAKKAIDEGFNRYTVTRGLPELREAVMERYRRRGVNAEDSFIVSGTSGGILLSFAVTLDPGDEIVIPDPYFVMYKHLANFLGAKPVYLDTYPDFKIRRDRLEACMSEKTKVIMLNSPTNPTGAVMDWEEIRMVAEVARQYDLLVISDEIYDIFQYDSPARSIGEIYPKTLVLNGFSKFAAMTGWRVGYALGPRELIDAMVEVQQYSFVCAPSMAQRAALVALELDTTRQVDLYRRKRDMIYEGLKDRFDVRKSAGAFYSFPGTKSGQGDKFVEEAIKNNLLIVPGSVFSERGTHFRISFASSESELERGIEILNRLADRFWGQKQADPGK